ncbi:MAG TPA: thioredoxin [Acidimicrobiia bacterium]
MPVIEVNEADFATQVIERSRQVPVVVDFWADWCPPCRMLTPVMEKVANEPEAGFDLAKVDVDANPRLQAAFRVQSIPTVIAFRDGSPVSTFTGAIPESAFRQFIAGIVPQIGDSRVQDAMSLADRGEFEQAETLLRELITEEPTNEEAGLSLASLLIDRRAGSDAETVLASLSPTAEVNRMKAAARVLGIDPAELDGSRLDSARRAAADGGFDQSLETAIELIESGDPSQDEARILMLDVFELLGPEHELTARFRRRLANALF